jgi:hypothetical protein
VASASKTDSEEDAVRDVVFASNRKGAIQDFLGLKSSLDDVPISKHRACTAQDMHIYRAPDGGPTAIETAPH